MRTVLEDHESLADLMNGRSGKSDEAQWLGMAGV
jgi:hypothetical protein